MLIFSVSFQKHELRESRVKKETTKIQRCSEPRVQQMSTAVDHTATIPRTRESSRDPGEQHTVTRKTCVLVKKCHPRVTFDAPKPDTRNSVQQRRRKHGQREILESRDIRQVPNKRRDEVQSQNRDFLIRETCVHVLHPGATRNGDPWLAPPFSAVSPQGSRYDKN